MAKPLHLTLCSLLLIPAFLVAAAEPDPVTQGQQTLDKALAYLQTLQQADGSFRRNDREPPALTAMVLRAMAMEPKLGANSPAAKKAIQYLLAMQRPDGGIYKDMLANYNTAIAISGLAATNDPAVKEPIAKAVAFLKASQFSDAIAGAPGKAVKPDDPAFGGWNYGAGPRGGRADVSNTAIALDALKDAGVAKDDPAYQNALKFVARMQNLSETNPAPWATNDGGFVYNPGRNGEGESAAGEYTGPDGKRLVRSYGSMTYAGLKSMLYAGVAKDDPRVKAAWAWIRGNWSLDQHPGMAAGAGDDAKAGIFYYYNVLARALAAYGEPVITDPKTNAKHDWRVELIQKLSVIQQSDGSFVGTDRWMESDPLIATCLATLALQDALHDLRDRPVGAAH